MATVLIVEDDKSTRLLTEARLKLHFAVICASDGLEALQIFRSRHVDIIVADIMMPKMDGYELVKTIRSDGFDTPILLLTAKQAFEDKREGFNSGTDDYMTKPVNYEELLMRLYALLRRAKIAGERKITVGETTADSANYTLTAKDKQLELSKKEFDLLFKLLSYPNVIFTRNQLLDEIWGLDSESGEDTVKTHINRLRNKLEGIEDFEIITIRGLGYKASLKSEKLGKQR